MKRKAKFPNFSFNEKMNLLGYARYMGYEFDYNKDKKKAILVKTDNDTRNVLYLAKERGIIIGIDKDGKKEMITPQMNITKILHDMGIFKIPEDASMGVNEFVLENLNIIGAK